MKKQLKFFAAFAILAALVTGCEKENDDLNELSESPEVIVSGNVHKPAVINGQTMIYNFQRNNLKGLVTGEDDPYGIFIDQQIIKDYPYNTMANSYRVIKVFRPSGRYFWIMIDNFKYDTGSGCWIYGNNASNLATYGRLYNWTTAYNNKTKIMMKLPKIVNGVPSAPVYTVFGKLPSFQDIRDLLETSTIGNLPQNGTTPYDGTKLYYDAFLAGREDAYGDYTKGYPSLAGGRNCIESYPGVTEYFNLNEYGSFWTNEPANSTPQNTAHYPLVTCYNSDYFYSAYINAAHEDHYGFSVRYVFEPIYQ